MSTPQTTEQNTAPEASLSFNIPADNSAAPQPVSGAALRQRARPFITNPATGNTYHVRKITISDLIRLGVLPDGYVAEMLTTAITEIAAHTEQLEDEPAQQPKPTDADILRGDDIRRAIVRAALLSPRIVDDPQTDDECAYEDLPASDRGYIYLWATNRLDDATVSVAGEDVSADALRNFPANGASGERAQLGDDRATVRRDAGSAVADR